MPTLEELESELIRIKDSKAELENQYQRVRDMIFTLMDQQAGEGVGCSLQSQETGDYLQRQYRPSQPQPMIDWDYVEKAVGPKIWMNITKIVNVGDEELLFDAVELGEIDPAVLERAISYQQPRAYLVPRKLNEEERAQWEANKTEEMGSMVAGW